MVAAKRARQLARGAEAKLPWANHKSTVLSLQEIAAATSPPKCWPRPICRRSRFPRWTWNRWTPTSSEVFQARYLLRRFLIAPRPGRVARGTPRSSAGAAERRAEQGLGANAQAGDAAEFGAHARPTRRDQGPTRQARPAPREVSLKDISAFTKDPASTVTCRV